MKLRIAALVVLTLILIGTTLGAVFVGPGRPIQPDNGNNGNGQTPLPPPATTAPVQEPVPQPSAQNNHLRFLAAGDNLVYHYITSYAKTLAGNGGYHYAPMYEKLSSLVQEADLAFYNQDSLVTHDESVGGMSATLGNEMVAMGFNVVNIANNSMLEKGEQGLKDSVAYWREKSGVALLGANLSPETRDQIVVVEKNNVKIAFLSYTYGVDGLETSNTSLVFPLIEEAKLRSDVALAKSQADLVFVYLHWGVTDQNDRNADQSNVAQLLVDLNVDVILGSHPNVIQEMKWKTRADGGRTLICYSLGNLISAQPYTSNLLGGLVTMDIDKGEDGRCRISNVEFLPTFTHYDKDYQQISVGLLKDYSQALLDTHGSSINQGKSHYDKFIQTVKKYIPADFLDDYYNNYRFQS